MGIFAKDAFVANRHGKGGTHSHSIRGWLVRDATKPVPYEVSVCMVPPDESLPCTVLPFDTSWLIEPTTGVHQFEGGSVSSLMTVLAPKLLLVVYSIGEKLEKTRIAVANASLNL